MSDYRYCVSIFHVSDTEGRAQLFDHLLFEPLVLFLQKQSMIF